MDGSMEQSYDGFAEFSEGFSEASGNQTGQADEPSASGSITEADARQEAENRIKAFMGDAQAIPGLCTWKNNRGSTEVNHEGGLLELLSTLERQGVKGVRQTAQTILEQFTTTIPGARVLRFAK